MSGGMSAWGHVCNVPSIVPPPLAGQGPVVRYVSWGSSKGPSFVMFHGVVVRAHCSLCFTGL